MARVYSVQLRPRPAVRPEQPAALQHMLGAALDDNAVVAVQVAVIGGEASGPGPDVGGDRLEAPVVDAQQTRLGADPHFPSPTAPQRPDDA